MFVDPELTKSLNRMRRLVDDTVLQAVAGNSEQVDEGLRKIKEEAEEARDGLEELAEDLESIRDPHPRISKRTVE